MGGQSFSTSECRQRITFLSAYFLHSGIKKGDIVLFINSKGSPLWVWTDLALQQIGVVVAPIHEKLPVQELEYIVDLVKPSLIILAEALEIALGQGQKTFLLAPLWENDWWVQAKTLVPEDRYEEVDHLKALVQPADLATIIFTSGATGIPKGVMLSHANIVSNIKSIMAVIPVCAGQRVYSFLPLHHVFERTAVYTYIATGVSVYFSQGREFIAQEIKRCRPHYFTAVPKSLEVWYSTAQKELKQRPFLFRWLFNFGIQTALRYHPGKLILNPLFLLKLVLTRLFLFRPLTARLGGSLKGIIVGAAALPDHIATLFIAAGIAVKQGYGLTEAAPVVSFNRFEAGGSLLGSVGIAIPGVLVKIMDADEQGQGEIWVKGPNVMMGYYKDEASTSATLTTEGWLKTGDLGKIVKKRFLYITGRKKDLFKLANGKYVEPLVVETLLEKSKFISQSLAYGADKAFVAAAIVPDFEALQEWCSQHNVHWTSPQFMVHNPKVVKLFYTELEAVNAQLPTFKAVKKLTLFYEPWTLESGELTITYKLRRHVILERNKKALEDVF